MRGVAAVAFAHGSAAESSTLIPRYHKILILCIKSMVLFFVQGSTLQTKLQLVPVALALCLSVGTLKSKLRFEPTLL